MTVINFQTRNAPQTVERLAANALRQIAADPKMRENFVLSDDFRRILSIPASRYILGNLIADIRPKLSKLYELGYRVGVEYVGEEIRDTEEVDRVVNEYLSFLEISRDDLYSKDLQIGFDLSNVGLLIDKDVAVSNTRRIARVAADCNVSLVISMERSTFTDAIISVFEELAQDCSNVGISIQAQLHRSEIDLERIIEFRKKIRLVKGVYAERPDISLPRGPELNERYIRMANRLAESESVFAIASHDPAIIHSLHEGGALQAATELEMLHGCNPTLLREMKEQHIPSRISAVYGDEFLLHFLHRLAESTPNILEALADYAEPRRIVFGEKY